MNSKASNSRDVTLSGETEWEEEQIPNFKRGS